MGRDRVESREASLKIDSSRGGLVTNYARISISVILELGDFTGCSKI